MIARSETLLNSAHESARRLTWAIVTGEYPPQPGGVSDHTWLIARALADCGDEVHVYAPRCSQPTQRQPGVRVHRLTDHFGRRGLPELGLRLDSLPRPYRLLVQYVPQAFGMKGMNLPFCVWLAPRRPRVIFHEAVTPFGPKPAWLLLAACTRVMAFLLVRAAEKAYVSTPAWRDLIKPRGARSELTWLPVFSNIPCASEPADAERVRARLAPLGNAVVGHFGTFAEGIGHLLRSTLPKLLKETPGCGLLLIGRRSIEFARELERDHPELRGRVHATGALSPRETSAAIAACDVMVQPYPDGATTRRTTLMAGMALGRAIVTMSGHLTEDFWSATGAVVLAANPDEIVHHACALLGNDTARERLGARASLLYSQRFAIEKAVEELRS